MGREGDLRMIPLIFGVAFLAGFVGIGLCVVGIIMNLPFAGRERKAYWLCAGSCVAFGLLATLLSLMGVQA